ncbi:MAG: S-layer homology domain-containing protein [Clostridiales bacterium]|nr:S-layer homology domain-containing protein [Clostridiales bacterium]
MIITNTGTGTVTSLEATLGGLNFDISTPLSAATLNPGETAAVSVRPVTGLSSGDHTDTLTITADHGISLAVPLSFTVLPLFAGPAYCPPPEKTIAVTETSSEVFKNTAGTITAEANMEDAFSNSVEVKVTDTQEDAAGFMLSAGDEVFPFDISLYIKGTDEKTEPAPGYAVTISLPVPENLLDVKELLTVMHKSDGGLVTEITSRLLQKDGVWYLVFEATEFSPYALVVRNAGSYDETAGVPYYLDANGNRVFIGFAANGRYIAPKGATVSVMLNGKSYTDAAGHWAAGYIGFVTEREIFIGTGDGAFSPYMGMTRAMFATVVARLYERSYGEIDTPGSLSFTDCDGGAYYGRYVAWAAENGIVGGYGNGLFGPDDLITREQMAAMLCRFADFLGVFPSSMDTVLDYPDADSISDYAKTAALYCQTTGVIGGRDGGVFAPQETATRAEVAAIIQRFVEFVLG